MKNTMIDNNKINDAVMRNAPLDTLIALCRDIDIESCFDPVFEPPKSFLDVCKRLKLSARSCVDLQRKTTFM